VPLEAVEQADRRPEQEAADPIEYRYMPLAQAPRADDHVVLVQRTSDLGNHLRRVGPVGVDEDDLVATRMSHARAHRSPFAPVPGMRDETATMLPGDLGSTIH